MGKKPVFPDALSEMFVISLFLFIKKAIYFVKSDKTKS